MEVLFLALLFQLLDVGLIMTPLPMLGSLKPLAVLHAWDISTLSIGSGIPEMKTVLRGITLTDYLSFRTFISKAVSDLVTCC